MINDELDFSDAKMLRKTAEEKLKVKKKKAKIPVMETDVKKLVHELQVHQIELEMQNDELRLAYKTAETALKKYTMLYDLSPMGYFTIDSEGIIYELNFTGADLLHDRHFSLVDANFKLFVAEKSLPSFNKFMDKVFSSNAKESCTIFLGYEKNILTKVYMEGIVTGEEKKCLLSVVDISNFKNQ
jgi:hypothetical protein